MNTVDSFMSVFAHQGPKNEVIGIDIEGLVQRLLLFDRYTIASIWLRDIQYLLRIVDDPTALCELIDTGALNFYVDSATVGEIGQVRSTLNLTGNTTPLRDNEFSFANLRGRDDPEKIRRGIDDLSKTEGVSARDANRVAESVEAALLPPKGLELNSSAFRDVYKELRSPDSSILLQLIAQRLRKLGSKPTGLEIKVEEFVPEDFRVISNLGSRFGLSSQKARELCLRSLLDLFGFHSRLMHMREFSCLLGMNESEQFVWNVQVDSLVRQLTRDGEARERRFTRIAKIAGLGENNLVRSKRIDVRRIIQLRNSDELVIFKNWLRTTDNKSDEEIRERVRSLRARIGNTVSGRSGKLIRLFLTQIPGLIPDPRFSIPAGLVLSAFDSFFIEKLVPKDAVLGILGNEYPAIFGDTREPPPHGS